MCVSIVYVMSFKNFVEVTASRSNFGDGYKRPKKPKSGDHNGADGITLIQSEGGIKQRLRINSGKGAVTPWKVGSSPTLHNKARQTSDNYKEVVKHDNIKKYLLSSTSTIDGSVDRSLVKVLGAAEQTELSIKARKAVFDDVCQEVRSVSCSDNTDTDTVNAIGSASSKATRNKKVSPGPNVTVHPQTAKKMEHQQQLNGPKEVMQSAAHEGKEGSGQISDTHVLETPINKELEGQLGKELTETKSLELNKNKSKDTSVKEAIQAAGQGKSGASNKNKHEEELEMLTKKRDATENGTMERMFLDMQIAMKKDNMEMMAKIDGVVNTTNKLYIEVNTLKSDNKEMNTRLQNVQDIQEDHGDKLSKTSSEIELLKDQVRMLQGVTQRQNQSMGLMKIKSDSTHYRSMKDELFISGLEEEGEGESEVTTAELVTGFFTQTMKITEPIVISEAKRVGKASPKTVSVKLKNSQDKGVIFKHVKNLKGVRNNRDGEYYINNSLPPEQQERRRKYRTLIN